MKILQVIPAFAPKFGGAVNSTYITSQKLAERGHEVTVLTTDYQFDSSYAQQLKNVEVISIKSTFYLSKFVYSPLLKDWLSENLLKYDIIHMQGYRSYQNAIVSDYALKLNIPYILQARGSVLPFFEKQYLKISFDAIWGNRILKNAACCIALSKTESDQYEKMGVPENKIVIIPNGIDISQYADLPPRGQFRSKYGIPENERIILFLGRIHKIKGIDLLVASFSQLCSDMKDVKLIIAGPDGGYLSQIQQKIHELRIENDVIFTGPLYNKDKLEAYIDADIYVLPSRYEAFPNTILEAWVCGTPVIVTEGCLIADIVKTAGYVASFDKKDLEKIMLTALTDKKQRINNIKCGLILINKKFRIEYCLEKIENLYNTIKKK